MFSRLRRCLVVTLAAALLIPALGITTADAARHHKSKHIIHHEQDRFAEIVMEANTGYVISEKNADKRLYPASLTKMMTLYLAFDALEDGTLSKNQRLPVSKHASAQEPSSLGLSPGETIRVEDLILSIATKSANDSAVVIAEALGGSEEHFARMMTAKAQELGMTGSHFLDASGLFKPGHYSTARDMAILAQALIKDHPHYYHVFSTETFTYKGEVMANHNHLMSSYRGMDGLKTGYVYASGYNLAASAVRNNTRLIGVIFGGATAKSRNNAMAMLLNKSFAGISDGSIRINPGVVRAAPRQQQPEQDEDETEQQQHVATAAPVRIAPIVTTRAILPSQRPFIVPAATATQVATATTAGPRFNAMGLVVDQGDAADSTKAVNMAPATNPLPPLQPQPINNTPIAIAQPGQIVPQYQQPPQQLGTASATGSWAIQIGAFASRDSGEQALQTAKSELAGLVTGSDSIAPLMTPQGMIYRARLSGLSHTSALHACGVLKGNCLVLSVE